MSTDREGRTTRGNEEYIERGMQKHVGGASLQQLVPTSQTSHHVSVEKNHSYSSPDPRSLSCKLRLAG